MGLVTIFYSLIFDTSLFVASYDSQGYGGGIRPRLHTDGALPPSAITYIREDLSSNHDQEDRYPDWICCSSPKYN
jgi:hypothetical protein